MKYLSTVPIQGALNKCSDSLLALAEIPCRRHSSLEVILGVTFWRRKWQPTPVFLHGKFHGQTSLVGYSLWGHKKSDTAEPLHFTFSKAAETSKDSWVSLTLDVGYLFMAAPAKHSRCSLSWTSGISSPPPLLTFNVG